MADQTTKTYLGDGVYADFDGYVIVLTTENGLCATNRIVLEPEVCEALVTYMKRVQHRALALAQREEATRG